MTSQPRTPVQAYQEHYVPAIFEPLSRHVIDAAAPTPGMRVVDVACGTGVIARAVAPLVGVGGRVIGIDVSPAMLDVARSLPAPAGAAIEWRQGDATALELPDASVDLAYCQQGLQYFPDWSAGAAELRRVLGPDGRAVVATWQGIDVQPLFAALADVEERHLSALGAAVSRDDVIAPFALGDAGALRGLLRDAGFATVDVFSCTITARFVDADHFIERMEYGYAAVFPQFAADPAAFQTFVDAVAHDTKAIVAEYRDGDAIVFPMHTNIAVAHA